MSRVVTIVAILIVACFGTAAVARAQSTLRVSPGAPTPEVGVFYSTWSIGESGTAGVGARLTVHRSNWLSTEYNLEANPVRPFGRTRGMLIVNARLSLTDPTRTGVLLTAGGALGVGYRRTLLPMVGIGGQRISKGVGTRVELQYFPGGAVHERNNARLTFGIVITGDR